MSRLANMKDVRCRRCDARPSMCHCYKPKIVHWFHLKREWIQNKEIQFWCWWSSLTAEKLNLLEIKGCELHAKREGISVTNACADLIKFKKEQK